MHYLTLFFTVLGPNSSLSLQKIWFISVVQLFSPKPIPFPIIELPGKKSCYWTNYRKDGFMASWLEVSFQDYRSVVLLVRYEIIYLKERKGRSQTKEICLQKTSLSYTKGPFTSVNAIEYVIDIEFNCYKPEKVQSWRSQNSKPQYLLSNMPSSHLHIMQMFRRA